MVALSSPARRHAQEKSRRLERRGEAFPRIPPTATIYMPRLSDASFLKIACWAPGSFVTSSCSRRSMMSLRSRHRRAALRAGAAGVAFEVVAAIGAATLVHPASLDDSPPPREPQSWGNGCCQKCEPVRHGHPPQNGRWKQKIMPCRAGIARESKQPVVLPEPPWQRIIEVGPPRLNFRRPWPLDLEDQHAELRRNQAPVQWRTLADQHVAAPIAPRPQYHGHQANQQRNRGGEGGEAAAHRVMIPRGGGGRWRSCRS